MNKKLFLLTVSIYSVIASIIFLCSFIFQEKQIQAEIFPLSVEVNTPIHFIDSTSETDAIIWEFGNGDYSEKKSGLYSYKKPGKYKARITLNNKNQKTFLIDVRENKNVSKIDTSVSIHANRSGITGEKVHFKAIGTDIEWCEWYFSGLGNIESRQAETFHSFVKPGSYQVLLLTNLNSKKPVRHVIVIEPAYKITENTVLKPVLPAGSSKKEVKKTSFFQDALQAIAYGKDFNSNYSFLLTKYLCSNPKTPVIINSSKTVDFYSFCQGLQLNGNIVFKKVSFDIQENTGCTKLVAVEY